MSFEVNAKELYDALKKIIKVTNGSIVNCKFENGILNLKTVVNQYMISYNLPAKGEDSANTEKFQIKIDTLMNILVKKVKASFKVGGTLAFKTERSKGELAINPYEDLEIKIQDGKEALKPEVKDFIFQNLDRINLLNSKEMSSDVLLQTKLKNGRIKMVVGDHYTQAYVNEEINSSEEATFNMVLKYADIITSVFKGEEDLYLYATPSTLELSSPTCTLSLPRIAEDTISTIEDLDNFISANITQDNKKAGFLIKAKKPLIADLDELKGFFGNSVGGNVIIKVKDGKVYLCAETSDGTLEREMDYVVKADGEVKAAFKMDTFYTCITKCLDGEIYILILNTFCTIRAKSSKQSLYILSRMDGTGYGH